MVGVIREMGRELIIEKINALKKNEHMSDDLFTAVLKNHSKQNHFFEAIF